VRMMYPLRIPYWSAKSMKNCVKFKLRKIFSVNSLSDIKILNKEVMGNVLVYFREIMKKAKIDSV